MRVRRLLVYGGTLLTVLSLFLHWVQPHATSDCVAGPPTPWLATLVLPTALVGAVLVFCGAILDTLEDKRRERELNSFEELVFAHATRAEVDALRHELTQLKHALLEKRNETV